MRKRRIAYTIQMVSIRNILSLFLLHFLDCNTSVQHCGMNASLLE